MTVCSSSGSDVWERSEDKHTLQIFLKLDKLQCTFQSWTHSSEQRSGVQTMVCVPLVDPGVPVTLCHFSPDFDCLLLCCLFILGVWLSNRKKGRGIVWLDQSEQVNLLLNAVVVLYGKLQNWWPLLENIFGSYTPWRLGHVDTDGRFVSQSTGPVQPGSLTNHGGAAPPVTSS